MWSEKKIGKWILKFTWKNKLQERQGHSKKANLREKGKLQQIIKLN